MSRPEKSFTLIELLVVIAIIGLLASVVLVSTQGLQTKAKLTKTLEFSQTLNNALGAYAVGSWSFDEGSGTSALDASGYGNDGTISGATYNADTPHLAIGRGTGKYALSFDGVNDYVDAGSKSTLAVNADLTITAWIKPSVLFKVIVSKSYAGEYELYMDGSGLFHLMQGDGTPEDIVITSSGVPVNQWSHIAIVRNMSTRKLYGYINGADKSGGGVAFAKTPIKTPSSVIIGQRSGNYIPFQGLMDEFQIYEQAMTLGQIQQLYAEGLKSHQDLALK